MESNISPPEGGTPVTGGPIPSKEERTLAMICHLLAFAVFILPYPPVFNIIAPLVLWLIKKDAMPFVDTQGKQVLNFQITVSLLLLLCSVTWWLLLPIGLYFIISLAAIILVIIGAIQANEGKAFRYPISIRFIP